MAYQFYSKKYGVDPYFAASVAYIESGGWKEGPLPGGKFIAPMGIHRCFRKKWNIDDPIKNIKVGTIALGKHKRKTGTRRKALAKYNTEITQAYTEEVMGLYRQIRRRRLWAQK